MQYQRLSAALAFAMGLGLVSAATAHAAPAPAPETKHHAFGLDRGAARASLDRDTSVGTTLPVQVGAVGAPPASYSLQQYALPAGDQGPVGSCVTWATGYTGYGVLMNEQQIGGGPQAPMFIYSQIAQGNDTGTYAGVALPLEQQQGIDTKSDYWQGDFDYTTQPDAAERANAAHFKLSGAKDLTKGDIVTNIKKAIAAGLPVPIGFDVRESFQDLDANNSNYDPSPGERILGGHEVTIIAYDAKGVTLENSWGSGWGKNGFFTAPWSFIIGGDVNEIHSMGRLIPA
ncbi:C1 family peptidase [Nocardia sp. CDC159]|uniref:C1 family peptidase n=1 Tax=Nocardia pulmonis TaxID=2951408 RepID=A0A9X2ITP6_9NOCA|nr:MULTISPECIES: C1 family peptidase [Nocardia]MCM6772012.1 C1 family peptidase [Nocardia pulmonis]MCM6785330.1 C1 family peptidase [Nocardia sp. CDC159]